MKISSRNFLNQRRHRVARRDEICLRSEDKSRISIFRPAKRDNFSMPSLTKATVIHTRANSLLGSSSSSRTFVIKRANTHASFEWEKNSNAAYSHMYNTRASNRLSTILRFFFFFFTAWKVRNGLHRNTQRVWKVGEDSRGRRGERLYIARKVVYPIFSLPKKKKKTAIQRKQNARRVEIKFCKMCLRNIHVCFINATSRFCFCIGCCFAKIRFFFYTQFSFQHIFASKSNRHVDVWKVVQFYRKQTKLLRRSKTTRLDYM